MNKMLIALVVAILAGGPAVASEKTEVTAVIQQFVDAFNKGDMESAVAQCADQTSIIDDFAPHVWHGAGACAKWAKAYEADAKKNEITDGVVALGTPRHVEVTASSAYAVIPVDSFTYKVKGKPTKETGSTLTVALRKGESGWRITGWAWTQG
jgi:hypothetical protein